MNVMDLSRFEDGRFNIVFDKGTLDSLLCAENAAGNVEKMLNEIYRVLSGNGVYVCISYGSEDTRKPYLVGYILLYYYIIL